MDKLKQEQPKHYFNVLRVIVDTIQISLLDIVIHVQEIVHNAGNIPKLIILLIF